AASGTGDADQIPFQRPSLRAHTHALERASRRRPFDVVDQLGDPARDEVWVGALDPVAGAYPSPPKVRRDALDAVEQGRRHEGIACRDNDLDGKIGVPVSRVQQARAHALPVHADAVSHGPRIEIAPWRKPRDDASRTG